MKFEMFNGKKYVILDENEDIYVSKGEINSFDSINIKNTEKGLDITDNYKSSVINSISGNNMFGKIAIPPITPKKEIIKDCDEWIEMFKRVHDYFKEIILLKETTKEEIMMAVDFEYFSRCKHIDIALYRNNTVIKEGVSIAVDDENFSVYKYLLANVLDYYVSKNYANTNIDLSKWKGFLHSKNTDRIYADLNSLIDCNNLNYYDEIIAILVNHNLGESSQQIISNARDNIVDQNMGSNIDSNFDNSLRYSYRQYNLLFPEEQGPVLKKKRKK